MTKIAGVILSGGKSSRMGQDKACLKLGNVTLLAHMKNIFRTANIADIFISDANHISDLIANKGPLSGIHACLKQLQGDYDNIVFIPVDMPALNGEILQTIANDSHQVDFIHYENHIFPLRISINKNTIQHITNILNQNANLSIRYYLDHLDGYLLSHDNNVQACFQNLNTMEEWQRYENSH